MPTPNQDIKNPGSEMIRGFFIFTFCMADNVLKELAE